MDGKHCVMFSRDPTQAGGTSVGDCSLLSIFHNNHLLTYSECSLAEESEDVSQLGREYFMFPDLGYFSNLCYYAINYSIMEDAVTE